MARRHSSTSARAMSLEASVAGYYSGGEMDKLRLRFHDDFWPVVFSCLWLRRGHPRRQLLEPVEHKVQLRDRSRFLSCDDQEPLSVRSHVVSLAKRAGAVRPLEQQHRCVALKRVTSPDSNDRMAAITLA